VSPSKLFSDQPACTVQLYKLSLYWSFCYPTPRVDIHSASTRCNKLVSRAVTAQQQQLPAQIIHEESSSRMSNRMDSYIVDFWKTAKPQIDMIAGKVMQSYPTPSPAAFATWKKSPFR
jgi:hypothetical protein